MKYLLLITTMMLTINLFAQRGEQRGNRGERVEQQRIAYITTELDLTVEEAQKFWPIYNNYQDAKKELATDKINEKSIDDLTEDQAKVMLNQAMDGKKSLVALEADFIDDLKGVISAKKRLKLVRADREFKKSVLNRFKKRMKRGEKKDKEAKKEERKNKRKEEK